MAEAPPPTDTSAVPAAEAPGIEAPAAPPEPVLATLGVRTLLEAGAHFGHQTHRWNPKMRSYIFGERHGVHIVDLDQTIGMFRDSLDFLREITAQGGKVLFVGTKRQAQGPIKAEATRSGQFYVNNRWLGGMLTNFRTVRKSLDRYKELLELFADEERVNEISKKDRARHAREIERYSKGLEGLLEMGRLPDALFVIDVGREHIAINEARRLGIPIVAVVDTNCDPEGIEHVIPANDDATRAILLYCRAVAEVCQEGAALHEERIQAQVQEESTAPRSDGAAQAASGRRVVEINQPARRPSGRGGASRPGGRGGTRSAGGDPEEVAASPAPTPAPPAAKTEAAPAPDPAPAEAATPAAETPPAEGSDPASG